MKRLLVVLLLLTGCDDIFGAKKDAINAVRPRIEGGPVSACCGPETDKKPNCSEWATKECACVQNATIKSITAEPLGVGGERTMRVTAVLDGPKGKGTCTYSYGYGMFGGGGAPCKCE